MPKISSIFSSSLLRGKEMNGPREITINGWHEEYLYGKNEYVLELEDEQLGLKLTAALGRDIAAALDEDDFDLWPGRTVTIYPVPKTIKDKDSGEEKLVDMIRAMKSERDKPPPKKALKSPPGDDIPF